jgi:D-glycero-alpha-D-manno-heptose-7-phosphate kinase
MIITQTPLRISFFGGGTDFRGYYAREGGCVLSSAIDQYIYVIFKQRFDEKIRVAYTRSELVDSVDEVQHELVREAMRLTGISHQVEMGTLGDIPSSGSGLGSSSTLTVGLLNAMYTYLGQPQNPETLARHACQIEIDMLGKPIGKQDQYIAAYGGLRFIRFLPDERVVVEDIALSDDERRRFTRNLMLFYTHITRRSETILVEQERNIPHRLEVLRGLKELAHQGRESLQTGDFEGFGRLLRRFRGFWAYPRPGLGTEEADGQQHHQRGA